MQLTLSLDIQDNHKTFSAGSEFCIVIFFAFVVEGCFKRDLLGLCSKNPTNFRLKEPWTTKVKDITMQNSDSPLNVL